MDKMLKMRNYFYHSATSPLLLTSQQLRVWEPSSVLFKMECFPSCLLYSTQHVRYLEYVFGLEMRGYNTEMGKINPATQQMSVTFNSVATEFSKCQFNRSQSNNLSLFQNITEFLQNTMCGNHVILTHNVTVSFLVFLDASDFRSGRHGVQDICIRVYELAKLTILFLFIRICVVIVTDRRGRQTVRPTVLILMVSVVLMNWVTECRL